MKYFHVIDLTQNYNSLAIHQTKFEKKIIAAQKKSKRCHFNIAAKGERSQVALSFCSFNFFKLKHFAFNKAKGSGHNRSEKPLAAASTL